MIMLKIFRINGPDTQKGIIKTYFKIKMHDKLF